MAGAHKSAFSAVGPSSGYELLNRTPVIMAVSVFQEANMIFLVSSCFTARYYGHEVGVGLETFNNVNIARRVN